MHAPLPSAELRKLACDDECSRNYVCCGAPTPTKSMCARWRHWMALPEALRSDILKSYGRDEFANYRRNIDRAIGTWRQLGVWRVRSEGGGRRQRRHSERRSRCGWPCRSTVSNSGKPSNITDRRGFSGASAARPASKARGTVAAMSIPARRNANGPPKPPELSAQSQNHQSLGCSRGRSPIEPSFLVPCAGASPPR